MADYYTSFSEQLVLKGGKRTVDWVKKYLDQFDGEMVEEEHPMFEEQKKLAVLYDLETDYFYIGFDWKVESAAGKKTEIWLYSEEGGNPENVARFVQTYLKKFDPDEYFSFTWAHTCSKPRLSAFSGGGAFVTAGGIEWVDVDEQISKQLAAFEARKETEGLR